MKASRIKINENIPEYRWYAKMEGRQFWAENLGGDFAYRIIFEDPDEESSLHYVQRGECVVLREAEIRIFYKKRVVEL